VKRFLYPKTEGFSASCVSHLGEIHRWPVSINKNTLVLRKINFKREKRLTFKQSSASVGENLLWGSAVSHNLNPSWKSKDWSSFSRVGNQNVIKWRFFKQSQSPLSAADFNFSIAISDWPWPMATSCRTCSKGYPKNVTVKYFFSDLPFAKTVPDLSAPPRGQILKRLLLEQVPRHGCLVALLVDWEQVEKAPLEPELWMKRIPYSWATFPDEELGWVGPKSQIQRRFRKKLFSKSLIYPRPDEKV